MSYFKKQWRKMWRKPVETPKEKRLRIVTSILWSTLIIWAIIPGSTVIYKAEAEVEVKPMSTQEMITLYSNEYGVDKNLIYSVMMCESGGIHVIGDSGKAVGQFQFWNETWERYSRKFNQEFGTNEKFDKNSLHDQIKLASWVFSLGEDARREWTTYRSIQNGGIYKFYSSSLKKHSVVKCSMQTMK